MIKEHEILKLLQELRGNGLTWEEITSKVNSMYNLNHHRSSYSRLHNRHSQENTEDSEKYEDNTITRKSNGELIATTVVNKNPANLSIEEIVKLFELDPTKWECIGFDVKVWNSMVKGEKSVPSVLKNYSVKARFKQINKIVLKEEDLSWIFDFTNSLTKPIDNTLVEFDRVEDNVLVLPILDTHLGKLAWGKETGENYDLEIASRRFRQAVRGIVERAKSTGFSKIIFPLGNDFFQYDTPSNETTRGTRVDSDLRWKKMFKVGIELLRDALDFCKAYAPIDVILVQGNHDNTMSFYAFEALRGWYNSDERITIDENIQTRTYRRVGVNLLGFTHGDKEKDNLYRIMQEEARDLWGKTKYSEWIVGHFHKNYVDEKQGVTKRVIGSFSAPDAWHYEQGYIGNLKSAQGIIYNKHQTGPYLIIHQSVE